MLTRVANSGTFKRLPRAVREQQMLDAAVRVFSRRGFHAASMDEVAEQAGISKPMVYAYLGTKDSLFVACLHREGGRLMDAVAAVAAMGDAPPDEKLWRGLRAFFQFVGAHRDAWAVLYRQARASEPFATELATMRRQVVDAVAAALSRALAGHGLPIREEDLETSAFALVGAGESLADWLADHSEEDPDRIATRLMNVAWMGAGRLLRGEAWQPPTWRSPAPPP